MERNSFEHKLTPSHDIMTHTWLDAWNWRSADLLHALADKRHPWVHEVHQLGATLAIKSKYFVMQHIYSAVGDVQDDQFLCCGWPRQHANEAQQAQLRAACDVIWVVLRHERQCSFYRI